MHSDSIPGASTTRSPRGGRGPRRSAPPSVRCSRPSPARRSSRRRSGTAAPTTGGAARAAPAPAGRGRGVSIFLGKNRRYIGKSQPERPPQRTQRTSHRQRRPCGGVGRAGHLVTPINIHTHRARARRILVHLLLATCSATRLLPGGNTRRRRAAPAARSPARPHAPHSVAAEGAIPAPSHQYPWPRHRKNRRKISVTPDFRSRY
jgi:hypothetical protein